MLAPPMKESGAEIAELFENPESFIEWIYPDDRDRVIAALKKLPSQFYDLEYRIFHPDGSVAGFGTAPSRLGMRGAKFIGSQESPMMSPSRNGPTRN
ncbi:MAG: PAS domain-containing protein [Candidatus Manganitrophus sp.]|nr:PAS domain-containing protein [Candidatus Manganitrophus sp.]